MTTTPDRARRRLRIATAATLVLLAGAAAGCGGSDDPATASPEASAAASASPSESPSSAVPPATGIALTSGAVTVNAPEGWEKGTSFATWQKSAELPDSMATQVVVQSITSLSPDDTVQDLADQAADGITRTDPKAKVKQVGLVELDGVEFFHNIAVRRAGVVTHQYGALVDGRVVDIFVDFDRYAVKSQQEREEIVASVLASVQVDA